MHLNSLISSNIHLFILRGIAKNLLLCQQDINMEMEMTNDIRPNNQIVSNWKELKLT